MVLVVGVQTWRRRVGVSSCPTSVQPECFLGPQSIQLVLLSDMGFTTKYNGA
ncbi:hypothetical protein I79_009267 [Cricetulus griseus]|uniref:Uncharacterized protein n=1 Tax=Cricetulus griseus TaxID=10029 RepID=G3HFB1_CRIGR|nr:hypothetical protein I79_009267 [Cricetulus griseus]